MRATLAKKLRKYSRRPWLEYVEQVKEWSFANRWRLCWYILFSKKHKRGKP